MSTTSTKRDAIAAALAVAEDLDSGKIDSADLDRQLRDELAAMFTNVVGPGDLCWELQVEVARAVLAVGGGVSADELSEWAAVARSREAPDGVTYTRGAG